MTVRARIVGSLLLASLLVIVLVVVAANRATKLEGSAPPAPSAPVAAPAVAPAPSPEPAVVPAAEAPQEDPATVYVEEDFTEAPPVDLEGEATHGEDVTVRLDRLERVEGKGAGPGEVAGPSVLVTVSLDNASADDVDLGAVVVDLTTGSGALGTPLFGDPRSQPFEGVAAAGETASATYVVRVPDDSPQIKVSVFVEAATPAATFLGEV